jgi:hypothetical protein
MVMEHSHRNAVRRRLGIAHNRPREGRRPRQLPRRWRSPAGRTRNYAVQYLRVFARVACGAAHGTHLPQAHRGIWRRVQGPLLSLDCAEAPSAWQRRVPVRRLRRCQVRCGRYISRWARAVLSPDPTPSRLWLQAGPDTRDLIRSPKAAGHFLAAMPVELFERTQGG